MTLLELRKIDANRRRERILGLERYIKWCESEIVYYEEYENEYQSFERRIDWANTEIWQIKKSFRPPKKRKKKPQVEPQV